MKIVYLCSLSLILLLSTASARRKRHFLESPISRRGGVCILIMDLVGCRGWTIGSDNGLRSIQSANSQTPSENKTHSTNRFPKKVVKKEKGSGAHKHKSKSKKARMLTEAPFYPLTPPPQVHINVRSPTSSPDSDVKEMEFTGKVKLIPSVDMQELFDLDNTKSADKQKELIDLIVNKVGSFPSSKARIK